MSEVVVPVQEIQKPQVLMIEGNDGRTAPVVLVPNGQGQGMVIHSGVKYLDEFAPPSAPEFTKGTAKIEALSSFIEHVNRFKREAESAIFIRRSPPQIEAVYDYHRNDSPAWAQHRAEFSFAPTRQWIAWRSMDGVALSQAQFAEFLESHSADIYDPSTLSGSAKEAIQEAETAVDTGCVHPAAIRALARGLEYHKSCTSSEVRNLRTGETKVHFEEKMTNKEGESLDIPGLFAIAVEMFDARVPGEDGTDKATRYVIPVRLRVRPAKSSEDGLLWMMLLHNVDRCVDLALSESAARVKKDTGLPVFWGSPEK
jgi:uncharacterized protein YfdQ (DUF2303 family)